MERRLKGQLILDFLGVLDADTRISSLGSDFRGSNAAATVIHTTSVGGRLNTDAFLEPVGLRIGGVDVSRVQPGIPDPVHGLNVSEKVTVPTFKVMAEVDKYFELSSHPGRVPWSFTAWRKHSRSYRLTSLDVTPARLRLVDASGSYTGWSVVMMNLPFQSLR
jgi:hypothetical protein